MVTVPDAPIFGGITRTQSWISPLDRAVEYIRLRPARLIPIYILSVLPQSMVVLFAVDAVASQHRSILGFLALLLLGTTIWRWIGMSILQFKIQSDLRGEKGIGWWRRLPTILAVRFLAAAGMTWGLMIVAVKWQSVFFLALWGIPYVVTLVGGLLLSGMITPLLCESTASTSSLLGSLYRDIVKSYRRIWLILLAMLLAIGWMLLLVIGMQYLVLSTIVSNLLGIDPSDVLMTTQGTAWYLAIAYLIQVGFDLFWGVVSVMLFYDLQSRRLGSDLRYRLQTLHDRSQ